jgi:hypothetical protein
MGLVAPVRTTYNILVLKPEGKEHSRILGVGGRIILKCILLKER